MSNDFGELALVVGDFHIPLRASHIPVKFQSMLVPNKIQHILCTGNLVSNEQYEELRNLAPNVHIVRGGFDENTSFPETKVVQIGQFKIGLIHGHQIVPWGDINSLSMVRRQLDVDILISGHTHKNEINQVEDKWFINPGSITGAYSTLATEVVPSFILLAVQGPKVVVYQYELQDEEVSVSKREIVKE